MADTSSQSQDDTESVAVPDCGLYILLPTTTDHEKQCFQLGQILHTANRFSSYAVNRHVVEFRPAAGDMESPEKLEVVARAYRETCVRNGFIFLIYDLIELAQKVDADGVICSSSALAQTAKATLGDDRIVGMRCQSIEDAQTALDLKLDFVCLYGKSDTVLKTLNWWTTSTDNPAAIEGVFDQENCAAYVRAGASFIESAHHIWTHKSGNVMQGTVNMLDAFERHKPAPPTAH